MTDQLQAESSNVNQGPSWVRLAVIGAVIAFFVVPAYLRHRESVAEKALIEKMRQDETDAVELDKINEAERIRLEKERDLAEQVAISKAFALTALEDIDETQSAIAKLESAQVTWDALTNEILNSKAGYAIASNAASVTRADELIGRPERLEVSSFERLQKKLNVLAKPIQLSANDPRPGYRVSEEIMKKVDEIQQQATKSTKVLSQSFAELRGLQEVAETQANVSMNVSLKDALAQLSRKRQAEAVEAEELRMQKVNAGLEAEVKAAKDAAARQIAEAKIKAEKELAQIRKRTIDEGLQLERKANAQKLAEDKLAAQQAKLEADFQKDLPEIKTYLACFIASGNNLRGPNPPADPGPVSYTVLVEAGLTSDTQNGLLYVIQGMNPLANDRSSHEWAKQGAYLMPERWGSVDMSFPRKAHKLLRKYGKLMAEKGLLAE